MVVICAVHDAMSGGLHDHPRKAPYRESRTDTQVTYGRPYGGEKWQVLLFTE